MIDFFLIYNLDTKDKKRFYNDNKINVASTKIANKIRLDSRSLLSNSNVVSVNL